MMPIVYPRQVPVSYQRKQDLFCVRAEYKPLDPANASVRDDE